MTLNGTLEDFSPAGILNVLAADGRTGAVRFGGPHGCTVYLHRGQLYFARDQRTDEALATALVRPGRLSADEWARSIETAGNRPMVGEVLVRDASIGADLLASVVLSVIYDPLIELFRNGTGEFEFEADAVHWLGPFRAFPVSAIVDEVRKRVREVDEWTSTISSLDVWVEARRTLPGNTSQVTLLRDDWELVTALSGPRMISDLAGELGRGAYSTARVVRRLQDAGLVEVVSTDGQADVVPIRRPGTDPDVALGGGEETDPLLAMGLPHRARTSLNAQTASEDDALTAHIGDAIADALAEADVTPTAMAPVLTAVADVADPSSDASATDDWATGTWEPDGWELGSEDTSDPPLASGDDAEEAGAGSDLGDPAPVPTLEDDDDDIFVRDGSSAVAATTSVDHDHPGDGDGPTSVDHDRPDVDLDPGRWDESRRFADGAALHHEDLELAPVDDGRPEDPNAAWLADLYSQFIDEPEMAANGSKKRRRGEPSPVDVAFKTAEQDGEAKVSTLKRLMTALKKL